MVLIFIIKYFDKEAVLNLIEILLEHEVDRTIQDYQRKTALDYAVEKWFDQIVFFLEN